MQKTILNNITINYTNKDFEYISNVISNIETNGQNILDFFNLKKLDKPTFIYFYDNIEIFKEKAKTRNDTGNVPSWLCGWALTFDNQYEVHVLSYEEYIKTDSHENDTIEDIIKLVLHEFTHNCYDCYLHTQTHEAKAMMWLEEGLATNLSNQRSEVEITCSLNNLLNQEQVAYSNYFTIVKYLITNFNHDYILNLIQSYEKQIEQLPNIYNQTIEWLKS